MFLSLTAFDREGEFRQFSCWLNSLEVILDALSEISANGGQLVTAEIHEEGSRLPLPVEAFDGQDFSNPIQALEAQWQQVLSEPVQWRSVHTQQLMILIQNRISRQDLHIAQLEVAIQKGEDQRQRVQDIIAREPMRSRLLARSEVALQHYQGCLEVAQRQQQSDLGQLISLLNR